MGNSEALSKKEALKKAQRLCAMQEKCTFDLENKLKEWGCNVEHIPTIVEKLKEENFLCDDRYAKTFVREKFRFNKWGKIKIAYQLKLKGISSDIIHSAFREINENEYYNLLYHELSKKNQTLRKTDLNDKKQKLFSFANSRGFENEITGMAIKEILTKES